ncbi:MAG: ABC transporter permease [Firmicutes bacterium HGW-Firmicutes-14]|jgi:ABC-type polysaccharide/polyol phosphate export permease|nr:MAG: ABC transporter permease [Firmicutes bacterium HGW-Firmicutes-14]
MMNFIKSIFQGRYILGSLIKQDLKNKYRNSFLGFAWSLITPLGLVLIIGIVFSKLLGQPIRTFIPYLFSGLIPWLYIAQCAEGGTGAFLAAEGYIKQTQTPIEVFPVRVAVVAFVQMLLSLAAFFLTYLLLDVNQFSFKMVLLIPALFIWLVLGIALSVGSAIAHTLVRDYGPIQSLILQGLFYATPIMYPAEILKDKNFAWIYQWNPFYYLMEVIRRPLMGQKVPDLIHWEVSLLFVGAIFFLSVFALEAIGRKIVFRI